MKDLSNILRLMIVLMAVIAAPVRAAESPVTGDDGPAWDSSSQAAPQAPCSEVPLPSPCEESEVEGDEGLAAEDVIRRIDAGISNPCDHRPIASQAALERTTPPPQYN